MVCDKCGYKDEKESECRGKMLCRICVNFVPENEKHFEQYVSEKVDWKILDSFRKYGQTAGEKLKRGMDEKAKQGRIVVRPPLGYKMENGMLVPNEQASKVHSLFTVFLEKGYSLNQLAKNYGLSVNGLKKVLQNRTYLGEVKFAGALNKGKHQALLAPEIFYAVQRKLKEVMRKKIKSA